MKIITRAIFYLVVISVVYLNITLLFYFINTSYSQYITTFMSFTMMSTSALLLSIFHEVLHL